MLHSVRNLGFIGLTSTVVVIAGFTSSAEAGAFFATDRFGYTGTVTRYDTETEARDGANPLDSVEIKDVAGDDSREHRDAAFYFANDYTGSNANILLGSWWYSTEGSAGHGNINGNTGIGFMQLYDDDGSTDTNATMKFQNFDGTYWTEYRLTIDGEQATPADDYARFSAYDNVHDAGRYIEYSLDVTAKGLQGTMTGSAIEANNHPTGVDGSLSAIFTFEGDGDGYPDSAGPGAGWGDDFYAIDLTFDMQNWAFANRDSLTYPSDGFADSQFVQTVPTPSTLAVLGAGLLGLGAVNRRRRRAA